MSSLEVYFDNHQRALKFPWSIYHKPLLANLFEHLNNLVAGQKVLVIGPGAFDECEWLLLKGLHVSTLDIDPRVLDQLKLKYGERIHSYHLVDTNFSNYPTEEFDFIYAKEVIEHLIDYQGFLRQLKSILKAQGTLWLSTPNYGFFLLPLLEKTVLEVIARFNGFSRKDIHPSRFSGRQLFNACKEAGFTNVQIVEMPFKLSLVAVVKKD